MHPAIFLLPALLLGAFSMPVPRISGELSTRAATSEDASMLSFPTRDVDPLTERDDADELAAYGWGVPRAMTKREEEWNGGECGGCGLKPEERVRRDDADELAAYGWGVPRQARAKRDDADELAAYGWGVPRSKAKKRDDADELAAYGWGVPKAKSKRDDADELAAYGWGVPR